VGSSWEVVRARHQARLQGEANDPARLQGEVVKGEPKAEEPAVQAWAEAGERKPATRKNAYGDDVHE